MKLINIGYGSLVSSERLVAVVAPDSAPIKRTIQEAREDGRLIDATYGRRTRAVIMRVRIETLVSSLNSFGSRLFLFFIIKSSKTTRSGIIYF